MNPKATRRWMRPAIAAAAAGAAIAVPLLTFGSTTAQASDGRLEPFQTCDDFVAVARQRALDMLATSGGYVMPMARQGMGELTASGAKQLHSTAPAAADTHSTTNVQVVGIDEPDVVKTDGRRTFAIADGKVYAIDTSGPTAKLMGSVTLPAGAMAREMLLSGNRLLVIAGVQMAIEPGIGGPETLIAPEMDRIATVGTTFVDVDVSDLAKPTVRESLTVDGSYSSARLTGSTARIVMNSDPLTTIGMRATNEGEFRSAIAAAQADNFIPSATFTDAAGTQTTGPLVACANISHPSRATPLGMLSIMTMDLSSGIRPVDSDAVMAQGATVMASQDRMYVALSHSDVDGKMMVAKTDIHVFDAATKDQTRYVATGTVTGTLLNQFAMSEYDGRLRVATTLESYGVMAEEPSGVVTGSDPVTVDPVEEPTASDDGAVGAAASPPSTGEDTPSSNATTASSPVATSVAIAPSTTESAVSVLELQGDKLTQVGRVAGLGKGEQIYAVRFIGPTGYVVTFRRTDPLYTVDLSNPTKPRVVGELKIPGYSSYLHPVDDHTLIGVGQMVDDGTAGKGVRPGTTVNGLQVALFDVSDPSAPKRRQVWILPGASSDAEYDAHAFLWWPATQTVVLPTNGMMTTTAAPDGVGAYRPAAIALKVTPNAIAKTATIFHPRSDQTSIRRSIVAGNNLFTFSDAGFKVSSLDGRTSRQWIAFK
jgi:hypothetical protein